VKFAVCTNKQINIVNNSRWKHWVIQQQIWTNFKIHPRPKFRPNCAHLCTNGF